LRTPAELRAFAEEHLKYEVDLVINSGLRASVEVPSDPFDRLHSNLAVEGFAVHARLLLEFLYKPVTQAQRDDALAQHYMPMDVVWADLEPSIPASLAPIKKRTDKEVAHLTYHRLTITPKAKVWLYDAPLQALCEVLRRFTTAADPSLLGGAREAISRCAAHGIEQLATLRSLLTAPTGTYTAKGRLRS